MLLLFRCWNISFFGAPGCSSRLHLCPLNWRRCHSCSAGTCLAFSPTDNSAPPPACASAVCLNQRASTTPFRCRAGAAAGQAACMRVLQADPFAPAVFSVRSCSCSARSCTRSCLSSAFLTLDLSPPPARLFCWWLAHMNAVQFLHTARVTARPTRSAKRRASQRARRAGARVTARGGAAAWLDVVP
jgi:hypothetical protein